jgi:phosphohistidine phosphatase
VTEQSPSPRHLIVLRHAKAARPDVPDRARPLTERGRLDAAAAGRWLADAGYPLDAAVCSPARRTVETWELAAAALRSAPPVNYDERVYGASVETLIDVLRETPPEVRSVVLVGHNPGLQLLTLALAGDAKGDALDRLREKFPTCALAVLAVPGDWSGLAPGGTTLVNLVVARG